LEFLFLYAGWDEYFGFQLYHSDPSGNYGGWKAHAIGGNNQSAISLLKQEWTEELTVKDSLKLAVKVMSKSMDSTNLSAEKLEFSTLSKDEDGITHFHILSEKEVNQIIKEQKEEEEKNKDKNKEKYDDDDSLYKN